MISYLKGKIVHKGEKHIVILTVSGVGYKVFTTLDTHSTQHENNETELWIHSVVREDAFDLYGFNDRATLEFFELLITISGIGPKSALGILSAATVKTLTDAIVSNETAYLTKISGISKKVAEKIVLELKGKVFTSDSSSSSQSSDIDAIEALKSLGYSVKEAKDALDKIPQDISDAGSRVKAALRILSK
jgi:Holliday junction DNA helicase RuvA